MEADGIRIGLYNYFNVWQVIFFVAIHFHKNTHNIPDFVGDILDKLLGVIDATYHPLVVYSNQKPASMGIGKATYPFHVLIAPRLFVFYVLIFLTHILYQTDTTIGNFLTELSRHLSPAHLEAILQPCKNLSKVGCRLCPLQQEILVVCLIVYAPPCSYDFIRRQWYLKYMKVLEVSL